MKKLMKLIRRRKKIGYPMLPKERKPINISLELGIAFGIVLFVPMLVTAWFCVTYFEARIEEEAGLRLRSDLKAAEVLFQSSVNEMRYLANNYARKRSVIFFTILRLGEKIGRELARSATHDHLDMITIIDTSYKIVARSHAPEYVNDFFPDKIYIRNALAGISLSGIEIVTRRELETWGWASENRSEGRTESLPDNRRCLVITSAAPVYDRNGLDITSAIILRRILDVRPDILRDISRILGVDANLYGPDGPIISGNDDHETSVGKALNRNHPVYTVDISERGRISGYLPVKDFTGNPAGVLTLRISIDRYLNERYEATLVLVSVFLIMFILAYIIKEIAGRRLIAEMTMRRRAENRVRELHHELLRSQEAERQKIALDLHDGIVQDLSAVIFEYETLFRSENDLSRRKEAKRAGSILRNSVRSLRKLSYGLKPPALDELGLVTSVSGLCEDFTKETGIALRFSCAGAEYINPDYETGIHIYRIVQEALNNIRKHSGADRASVSLMYSRPDIIINITDNGRGFDPDEALSIAPDKKKMGIRGIKERAHLLDGGIGIHSSPGNGTIIYVLLKGER